MSGRMDLPALRERIDRADEKLLDAFCERMRAARDIAEYKRERGLPVRDAAREQAVLERRAAQAGADMERYAGRLWRELMALSREYQRGQDKRKTPRSLALVGMPGCGKSTMGALLAPRLGLPLVDLDEELAGEAGMSIPEIFKNEGERGFRERERALLAREAAAPGRVIATGGGAVLDAGNREALRRGAFIVHIFRPLELLDTAGRPLSAGPEALRAMWRERAPLYAAVADASVRNDGTPARCADRIEAAYREAAESAEG